MAVDTLQRSEDYSIEQLIEEVHKSLEGHIVPGQRIGGRMIFFSGIGKDKPKHDVIFFWRALYIRCVDEYDFAMKVFGDWAVYKRFYKNSGPYRKEFQPTWEEERELRVRSAAAANVVDAVEKGDVKVSQWLEKHITMNTKDKKVEVKEVIETVKPIDAVMEDIENNYKNIN